MNKEFNGFDEMVEALEENEDMVECKECFDLVPKVDCERVEVGYICPTCKGLRTAPAQARFVDPYDSYTQEFPEVTEYDPDSVVEYEKEPGLGDALADLIKDEYEAIDGYEVADETIQHAAIDEDEKDEILDTLDHIKEEEEEHIDELKELCPECDPVAEPEVEPEKLEEAADDEVADEEAEVEEIPEEDIPEEEAEDSEENENEEVSDLESAYDAALEIANESGVGQVFGYARKDTEEFVAIEPFEVDDPEAVEDDLMAVYDDVAYAYVVYPEKELEESLFEGVQLNEGIFDKSAKIFNAIAAKGFEVVASPVPADNANAKLKSGQKFNKGEYDKAKKFAQMASSITKTSLWGIKIVEPEAALKEAGLTDASLLNLLGENKNIFTVYKAGKETVNNKTFLKDLATILKSHKMASKLGITDTTAGRDAFETEPEPEPEPKSEPGPVVEPEPKPEPETESKPETKPESEIKSETETETETEPETETETETEVEAETEPKVKLSDLSDEQLATLAKIFGNRKPEVVANTVNKLRAAFTKLGESVESPEAVLKALDDNATDLKATAQALKDVQQNLKEDETCTKTMIREEYHKYANPTELKVMEDLEAIIDAAKNDALSSMQNWGIDISESDAQGWMSGNNEYSYQFMLDYEGIDEDEEEDIQDQLQNLVENAILSQYTLPSELSKISVSVALPDRDIAYEDEDGEELQDVKRASLFVDVTFTRNLF